MPSLRRLDKAGLQLFGYRYLHFLWLRSYFAKRGRGEPTLLPPISQPDRSMGSWLMQPASKFIDDFKRPTIRIPFYFNGCNYDGADLAIYSYMLDRFRPKRIIEIGSGGSTQFAFWWGGRNKEEPQIIAIDPRMSAIYGEVPFFRIVRLGNLRSDLQRVLRELGNNPALRQELGFAARSAHISKYNWGRQFEKVIDGLTKKETAVHNA